MSGSWHVYPRGARWRQPRRSAWAVLAGERQEAVQFGGPTLRLLADRPPAPRPAAGPPRPRHPRAGASTPTPVVAALRADPARGLGDALLDQSLVAGIGNIFKSEACFAARVDPWRPVGDLADEELARRPRRRPRADAATRSPSGRHASAVYRRRGPCPVCGGPISSRGQGDANRTTYWCPRCQL